MSPELTQTQPDQIPADMLDEMIKKLAEETGFKLFFDGLKGPLEAMGYTHLFKGIEDRIAFFHTQLAKAAFEAGHEHALAA
jgi:hypothetical protein